MGDQLELGKGVTHVRVIQGQCGTGVLKSKEKSEGDGASLPAAAAAAFM